MACSARLLRTLGLSGLRKRIGARPKQGCDFRRSMIRRMENYRRDYGRAQMPFEYKFMPLNADDDTVSRLAEIGVSDVICVPWLAGAGPAASLEEKRAALRRFSDEVIARHR